MKIVFFCPTGAALDPRLACFFSDGFLASFSELGAQVMLIGPDDHDQSLTRSADREAQFRPCDSTEDRSYLTTQPISLPGAYREKLRAFFHEFAPDVIQTFGYASRLAPIWAALRKYRYPIAHFVTAGGPLVDGDKLSHASARITPQLNSFAGLRGRHVSRQVCALIGSNRCDLAYHRDSGYFRRARFSVVAGVPVTHVAMRSPPPRDRHSTPRFGFFSFDDATVAVTFLLSAVGTIGTGRQYSIVLSDCYRSVADRWRLNVEWMPTRNLDEFLQAVDIVVIPYADDSFAPVIVRAAAAGKIVVASEGGLAAEFLDYGRRGILFKNGSESDLASKMRDIITAWPNGPPLFTSAEELLAETSPKRCAEVFLSAYRRLAEEQRAEPNWSSATPLKRAK